ncbi:hypothetical protein E4U22_004547 [Claviceps purpurea]|nr:hypothetical protein E4U45_007523 [Claviceps purpurea]KAG6319419.1 hypothetical protein E4U22_004547 [Claviceps purpurea]
METKGEGKKANISYDSFISSKPFEFVVGPKKRVFTIHSALVASLSPVLERLVNGGLLVAKKRSVVWEHVDEPTFVRFSQYAYMKTYEYPLSTNRSLTLDKLRPLALPSPSPLARSADPTGQSQQGQKGEMLWEKFSKQLSSSEPHVAMIPVPLISTDHLDDDAEFLLSHARLHVFADRYGMKPLMRLSLSTLHYILVTVPEDNLTPGVVKLLQYCYQNETPAALKDLVVEYVVCRVETLWEKEGVAELARVHGTFSSAVIKGLLGRIT